MAGKERPFPAP